MPHLAFILGVKIVWKLWCSFWDRVEMNERDGRGAFEFQLPQLPQLPARGVKLDKVEVARLRHASKRRRSPFAPF